MRNLAVSNDQRVKLLEMARALFSDKAEHDKVGDGITLEEHPCSTNNLFVCFYHDDGTDRIHWFEFCLLHLAHKFDVYNSKDFLFECVETNISNPVDYLYEYYKQLQDD